MEAWATRKNSRCETHPITSRPRSNGHYRVERVSKSRLGSASPQQAPLFCSDSGSLTKSPNLPGGFIGDELACRDSSSIPSFSLSPTCSFGIFASKREIVGRAASESLCQRRNCPTSGSKAFPSRVLSMPRTWWPRQWEAPNPSSGNSTRKARRSRHTFLDFAEWICQSLYAVLLSLARTAALADHHVSPELVESIN